jgi:deoxyribose-phosphate aldolase
MVSIWRLAGVAEFRKTKSTPERVAVFSKVIGSACGVSAAPEIQTPAAVKMTILPDRARAE